MLLELGTALAPEDALIALRDFSDLHDCDVEIDLLGDAPGPYGYAVRIRQRTTLRTVVVGCGARIGELGRAVREVLWQVTP